jgi:hypothetical protein
MMRRKQPFLGEREKAFKALIVASPDFWGPTGKSWKRVGLVVGGIDPAFLVGCFPFLLLRRTFERDVVLYWGLG